ncbi:hypothetical protein BX616_006025 [Lobosporangium transversale]|uniref:C2H2-type domain-containing protein n=1 Tax=Lobosporangium transversale TaxID=64571 RepID=A0A1Y2FZE9_9FUNG|nr:hypothetical protein BCR41DRAFT_427122 [Lobosporangium transversale]XP_021875029.1 hypothetical protein BCR41DRAFT_402757 [Lobosporangium transversale]KAF9897196.1 hypothetical protein BX616_006025 [Lobosporangium transversale]ORY88705.1 hypothetical protein BCR41DRAFT_427122 [Lobosporangium transversale]ORY88929.1 hypothetical protein BCR41DRAFT_402757 [Lobosporangium transversale]|eukprot:XP_021875013.1 hypothetical protein BCR41DRAFT_427122 [Lobosporangium transversale]
MSEPTNFECVSCGKVCDSQLRLRNHKRDRHPGKVLVSIVVGGETTRVILKSVDGCFTCPVCNETGIEGRKEILQHTNGHLITDVVKTDNPSNPCFICNMTFVTAQDLDKHYDDAHLESWEVLEGPAEDDEAGVESLRQGKLELDRCTKNTILSNFLLDMLEPFALKHEDGTKSMVLFTPISAKRTESSPIVEIERIKRPKVQAPTEFEDLEITLASNRHGKLIEMEDYRLLDLAFYLQNYSDCKSNIAQNLAGALIQAGSQVILILKAEVYGREPSGDPHRINLVKPTLDVKKVSIIHHDNANKLIIGTLHWNALITSSIELTSGAIHVGADNLTANIASQVIIFGRKDRELNPLIERQTRSKFHIKHKKRLSLLLIFRVVMSPNNDLQCH